MKIFIALIFLGITSLSFARPQYAVRRKVNDCMACHFNPAGGGARSIFGKSVTARGGKLGYYSKQDLISADFRMVNINKTKKKNER